MRKLPLEFFGAYLKGGTKWPQIRAGINIYLLCSIGHYREKNIIDWVAFTNVKLTKRQINAATSIMKVLHNKSNIKLSKEVNIQDEWFSAKAAILKSLLHFLKGHEPHHVLSIKELLNLENSIQIKLQEDKNKELLDIFFKMCDTAKGCLDEFDELSELFVDLLSEPESLKNEKYHEVAKKNGLILNGHSRIENITKCLEYVECKIRNILKKDYDAYPIDSVCWGFSMFKKK